MAKLSSQPSLSPRHFNLSANFDFGERKTYTVDPPTELLSRVQAFLPQLEASNVLLAKRVQSNPQSIDIEHIDEGSTQYIEMKLGLGVFEDKSRSGGLSKSDEDFNMNMSSGSSEDDSEDDGSDSDSSADEDDVIITTSSMPSPRLVKPLPRRTSSQRSSRPEIVVLQNEDAPGNSSEDST